MAPTPFETYMLELVNRGRTDPNAEAARYGIDLNKDLAAGTINSSSKEPLAFSSFLNVSADKHSQSMLDDNYFSHTGSDGSTATERMFAANWTSATGNWTTGENISFQASTAPTVGFNANTIDSHHKGLFLSSGHRTNIMSETFSEVGIGQKVGAFTQSDGTTFNFSSMLTQNFTDGGRTFLTGVVITDSDSDQFYDIGEGIGGVTVTATGAGGTFTTTTWDSGAYALAVADGSYTVTFAGGTLGGTVTKQVNVSGKNAKVDALSAEAGGGNTGGGATSNNDVVALTSLTANTDLGAGIDTINMGISQSGATVTKTANGVSINTGTGAVEVTNVERLVFNDGTRVIDTGVGENGGMAYRIYQAAFARQPDDGGLGFWMGQIDNGMSLKQVAQGFLGSAEFQQVYGANPTNASYVAKLYENVLGRAGEEGGVTFWVSQLESGARDSAQALSDFSESPENVALVGNTIGDGFFVG